MSMLMRTAALIERWLSSRPPFTYDLLIQTAWSAMNVVFISLESETNITSKEWAKGNIISSSKDCRPAVWFNNARADNCSGQVTTRPKSLPCRLSGPSLGVPRTGIVAHMILLHRGLRILITGGAHCRMKIASRHAIPKSCSAASSAEEQAGTSGKVRALV